MTARTRERAILLVEDDPDLRALLVMTLESEGYGVIACPSAEAAQEALRQGKPTCLITDLRLPGISGLELVQWVRQVDRDVPCVVMSAKFGPGDQEVALLLGVKRCLPKPFSMEDLVALCQELGHS